MKNSRLIRILHFSPSSATGRFDGFRACLGLSLFLKAAIAEFGLKQRWELVWALPLINDEPKVHNILQGADVLVMATPTYGMGSPWFIRKFFEMTRGVALWGKPATAFATAGGLNTGAEFAVTDTLRSFQGLGANAFGFAQKNLVFGTQQKFLSPGEFDLIDIWFLQQFARTILLQAILRDQPDEAASWTAILGLHSDFYNHFPSGSAMTESVGPVRDLLNSTLCDPESGFAALSSQLGMDCTPPDASQLSFVTLLPQPTLEPIHSHDPN